MATASQIAANKLNAQKSTGPQTEPGKAASSRNRLSHGFCSKSLFIPGEKPEDFEALQADLTAEHQPANLTEQILVDQMAMSYWLSKRAVRLQTHAFITQTNLPGDAKFAPPADLGILMRYKTSSDNAFLKAHNQLLKVQKERKKSEIGFVPQTASEPAACQADPPPPEPEIEPETAPLTADDVEIPARFKDLFARTAKENPKMYQQMLQAVRNAA